MAYVGKTYNVEKTENLEGFIDSLGVPEDRKEKLLKNMVPKTLVKNADGSFTMSGVPTPFNFKSGEEFDHAYPKFTAKITITVDGNSVTQVQKLKEAGVSVKMDFTESDLVETITSTKWDGVAKIYYKV